MLCFIWLIAPKEMLKTKVQLFSKSLAPLTMCELDLSHFHILLIGFIFSGREGSSTDVTFILP